MSAFHVPEDTCFFGACFPALLFRTVSLQGDCSQVCQADSPSNNPVFGLRQEYRTGPEGVSAVRVSLRSPARRARVYVYGEKSSLGEFQPIRDDSPFASTSATKFVLAPCSSVGSAR